MILANHWVKYWVKFKSVSTFIQHFIQHSCDILKLDSFSMPIQNVWRKYYVSGNIWNTWNIWNIEIFELRLCSYALYLFVVETFWKMPEEKIDISVEIVANKKVKKRLKKRNDDYCTNRLTKLLEECKCLWNVFSKKCSRKSLFWNNHWIRHFY